MKSRQNLLTATSLIGLALVLTPPLISQNEQPAPPRNVTVTEIPGVIAAGAKWTFVWGQPDLADGIVAYEGGVLFAQEEPSFVGRLDESGSYSIFLKGAGGPGALGMDSSGRVFAVQRTCTDPGVRPDQCKVPTALAELYPDYKILTDNDDKGFGRLHDLAVDGHGGIFFNGPTGVFFLSDSGKLTTVTDNRRTNGIILSPDDKTLYFTNGPMLMACDVQADGTCTNQRNFAKLEAGGNGDGMGVDADGRVYVSTAPGVQVVSSEGKYLGLIPTPRPLTSLVFSGPNKKTLYVVASGATEPNGTEYTAREGVRIYSRSIYKIDMIAQGYMGRPK